MLWHLLYGEPYGLLPFAFPCRIFYLTSLIRSKRAARKYTKMSKLSSDDLLLSVTTN